MAIKILDKTKLDDKTQRLLLREISSMEKLHHPNIIRLYEVIHKPTRLYICMEYAPEGELYTKINEAGKLGEHQSRFIFSQVISAVDHMHSNNIIHRDIKAENIFFSNLNPYMVKIGDFGFSINATVQHQLNTYCGSPPYAAPELFRDDNYIGVYVDIWALGVLLYFMVTGNMPFRADTVGKLKRIILNGTYVIPSYVSDECQLLIRGILKPLPADRYAVKEIMDSAWLDGETYSPQQEIYQLNPALSMASMKKEEVRSYELLESLGLTRDILICTNLDNSFNQSKHKQFIQQSNGLDKNINLNSIPVINKELNQFLKQNITHDFAFGIKNLSPEMKQAINGTCRIIFHRIQKEARKEFNSEQVQLRHLQQEQENLNSRMYKPIINTMANNPSYSRNFHSNERLNSRQGGDSRSRPTSAKKAPESIFVKVNNNSKQNGFAVGSSQSRPLTHKSTDLNETNNRKAEDDSNLPRGQSMYTKSSKNRFSSVATHEMLYDNKRNDRFQVESQSVHQINNHAQRQMLSKYANDPLLKYDPRISSGSSKKKQQSLPNNNSTLPGQQTSRVSKSAKPQNRSMSATTEKSKLCNIL